MIKLVNLSWWISPDMRLISSKRPLCTLPDRGADDQRFHTNASECFMHGRWGEGRPKRYMEALLWVPSILSRPSRAEGTCTKYTKPTSEPLAYGSNLGSGPLVRSLGPDTHGAGRKSPLPRGALRLSGLQDRPGLGNRKHGS